MDIRELLRARLAQLDPALDTSDGSYADRVLITPVSDALGADPLATDVRDFLVAKYAEAFPNMPLARGDAISDILIGAAEVFLASYRQQLSLLRNAQSISRVDLLSDADADALAANWFVGRALGATAQGVVQVTVDRVAPIALNTIVTRFRTLGGTEFAPVANEVISSERIAAGRVASDRYTLELNVVAVAPGAGGNIAVGEIYDVVGIGNVVSVTNRTTFYGGVSGDTTLGLLSTKLPRAISERSLVTARGIIARLAASFSNAASVQVIGLDDPEMERDAVEADALSAVLFTGVALVLGQTALLSCTALTPSAQLAAGQRVSLRAADGSAVIADVADLLADDAPSLLRRADRAVWVRLTERLADGVYIIAVGAPASAILGGRQVGSDVHLGGRVDVYLRPNDEQPIELATVTAPHVPSSLFGVGGARARGTRVMLYTQQPLPRDIGRCVLEIGGQRYNLLSCERAAPGLLRAHVIGDLPTLSTSTAWVIHTEVGVELTSGRQRVFPNAPGLSLTVSGALGAMFVTADGSVRELSVSGVAQGDVLVLQGELATLVIDHVDGRRLYLRVPLHLTIPPTPATIQRAREATPSPLGAIRSVQLRGAEQRYALPLGLKISSLSSEGAATLTQRGFVAPSLYYALQSARVTGRPAHALVDHTVAGYSILAVNALQDEIADGVVRNHVTLRHSRTHNEPHPGASVLVALSHKAQIAGTQNQPIRDSEAHEFELWNELFLPGTRNIFITLSDTEADEPYHGAPAPARHDVLRIHDGPNRGSYLIADVTHGVVTLAASPLSGDKSATRRADMSNAVTSSRRFSCIKIYGEFPVRELEHVERDITLDTHQTIVLRHAHNGNPVVVTPLVLDSVSTALSGQFVLSPSASSNALVLDGLRALGDTCLYGTEDVDAVNPVRRTGATARRCDFSIIPAAAGTATLVSDNSDVYARAVTPSVVPLRVALRALTDTTMPEYRVPQHSVSAWGDTQLVIADSDALLFPSPRTDLAPSVIREFAPLSWFSHDLLDPTDLRAPDSVTLDVDPDVLLDPCDLLVHEERYLGGKVTLSSQITKLYLVPVKLTNAGLTQPTETLVITVGANMIELTVMTRDAARARFTADELAGRNAAGVRLGDVIDRYATFAMRVDQQDVGDDAQFGVDYALADRPAGTLRFLLQPEQFYHRVAQTVGTPVLSLATIGPGDRELRLVQQTTVSAQSAPDLPVGSILRVTHRGVQHDRAVVAVSGDVIHFDAPIATRDAAVRAYGVCAVDLETGSILLGAPTDFAVSGDGFAMTTSTTPNTYLHQGGASRPLNASDAGRAHISLWAVSESYASLTANDEELDAVDVRNDAFAPIRQHLGTALVQTVTSVVTAVSPTTGAQYTVAQRITCSRTPWLDTELRTELEARDASYLRCAFVLTDVTDELPEGQDVTAVSTVQVFERRPEVYHIAARSLDGDGKVAITARRGDVDGPGRFGVSSLFQYTDVDGVPVLTSFNKNNPYNVRSPRGRGALRVVATQLGRTPVGQSCPISRAGGAGFRLADTDRHFARGVDERLHVLVPALSADRIAAPFAINALHSALVGQVQSLVSSRVERAVCADTRARRMATAYVGIDARYEGGPSAAIMAARVREVINTAIAQNASLGVADVVALMINLGAARVYTPIEMYVCVEDMSRVRHRREISDTLSASQLLHVDATSRIISVEAAPTDRTLLGAQIRVTRGAATTTQLGTGGA